ncbi:MAG: NADH:ubiquinone reductase (Na(+)-transporting) subunit B [Gammaproteobacteria bacterium]|nr:NADH:ubiquinone reductase (Na(+)-transporting) subunit B [Gammaproteobacteria bacterium]NIP89576.1 NADH:ubiquinone reductase (Na(+)-transporting) subunit B [Gammaproteobacteria bacterium]NIR24409.1 NADH:ubiquinone reductase (Na(+)-transporting) subunit B [Gammaproteobacteria bacterium]NIS06078.1 NADH:ubiquinone reductase (Na(+)-transporting) subunit B [Gammaproteobacteria bacterium]NIU41316.1 NADH:ubiquinone reductase (Na(+)-transporting) subunit B [Gammaproteobacteria bacterium]
MSTRAPEAFAHRPPLTLQLRRRLELPGVMSWVVIALVPSVAMGLWNTGHQARVAIARLGAQAPPDWRLAMLEGLGLGLAEGGVLSEIVHGALYVAPLLFVAAVLAYAWEYLFARARHRLMGPGTLVTVLIFTLLLPPATPLWQCGLGISFAMVFGKLIFGGTGRNFLNPALTGLAFLYFSFPTHMVGDPMWPLIAGYAGTTAYAIAAEGGMSALAAAGFTWWDAFLGRVPGLLGQTSVLAALIGAAVLISRRIASWRIMAGVLVGATAMGLVFNSAQLGAHSAFTVPWHWHLVLGGVAFGAVFVATDPVSAPMTDPGRWIYGVLIGVAVVVIRLVNPAHPDGVLLAVLLGNLCAPLIDHFTIRLHARKHAYRRSGSGA